MFSDEEGLRLSASDVSSHLACRHKTRLDLELVLGRRARPREYPDPHLDVLRERGEAHERGYLEHLRARGLHVEEIPIPRRDGGITPERAAALTLAAMRRGVDVVAQGTLLDGEWNGRPDVLLRVDGDSALGAWSYEPHDTKLARETKSETLLQLCFYAALLESAQGAAPEWLRVITPASGWERPESYRLAEYAAYYRLVQRSLACALEAPAADDTYPTPCAHCDVCRWAIECEVRRRDDDHLCLVAGMSRAAERELAGVGVTTLAGLAGWTPPPQWRPGRGSRATYEKLHEQARVQLASRDVSPPVHELLPDVADEEGHPLGLGRLPQPSPGDLFLDLEGDAFWGDGGLEYLFGLVSVEPDGSARYRSWWAVDRAGERAAFDALMEAILAAWQRDEGFHLYHFAPYEPAALKRLASRHGSREDDVDRLLRGHRFVDLLQVVRQGVRAGVESYSIKKLEPLYDFARQAELRAAGRVRAEVEVAIERGLGGALSGHDRALVALYNEDDCRSTLALRDWLEARRAELLARGKTVPRPEYGEGEPSEPLSEYLAKIRAVEERLLAGVPAEGPRSDEQQARWLLAHSLEFHRREQKVHWWEFYRLAELDEEGRREEACAIAGLERVHRTEPTGRARCPVDRYRFPPQDVDTRTHDVYVDAERRLGTIVEIDPDEGWMEVKVKLEARDERPTSVFLFDDVKPKPKDASLLRLGQHVAEHGLDAPGPAPGGRDLLLRRRPRGCALADGSLLRAGEDVVAASRRLARELDGGVLPIQGPPGSGKTYTGAQMILELVAAGKKVGVTALSHKVIRKLLDEVVKAASEEEPARAVRCLDKVRELGERSIPMPTPPRAVGGERPSWSLAPGIQETESNEDVAQALAAGAVDVVGGTAWLWAREELAGAIDVLFVDEAGQMSLADALAAAPAARSIVLLGDPQQLEQPIQGAHPDGCAVAALEHLVGHDADGEPLAIVPPDRGLFLEHTRRMHPAVCRFTSEQFYEGRLRSLPGLEQQRLDARAPFDHSGLYHLAVTHDGCSSASPEEAEAIRQLVAGWLAAGACWEDRQGVRHPLGLDDVLVVAPYNAQVALLRETLPPDARVGTVDKFQGQEAPVVVYSMTTSTPADAPRGMEFLYSLNRLNVATSRAKCACVLVASPRLLEPECRTPRQMRLANALCRYVEMATRVPLAVAAAPAQAASTGTITP